MAKPAEQVDDRRVLYALAARNASAPVERLPMLRVEVDGECYEEGTSYPVVGNTVTWPTPPLPDVARRGMRASLRAKVDGFADRFRAGAYDRATAIEQVQELRKYAETWGRARWAALRELICKEVDGLPKQLPFRLTEAEIQGIAEDVAIGHQLEGALARFEQTLADGDCPLGDLVAHGGLLGLSHVKEPHEVKNYARRMLDGLHRATAREPTAEAPASRPPELATISSPPWARYIGAAAGVVQKLSRPPELTTAVLRFDCSGFGAGGGWVEHICRGPMRPISLQLSEALRSLDGVQLTVRIGCVEVFNSSYYTEGCESCCPSTLKLPGDMWAPSGERVTIRISRLRNQPFPPGCHVLLQYERLTDGPPERSMSDEG